MLLTEHRAGTAQPPKWVCRAGSGSDDLSEHSVDTGVGEETHVTTEQTIPLVGSIGAPYSCRGHATPQPRMSHEHDNFES